MILDSIDYCQQCLFLTTFQFQQCTCSSQGQITSRKKKDLFTLSSINIWELLCLVITVHQQPVCCTQQLCTYFWDTWYCNVWRKTCQIMRWYFHGISHFTSKRKCSVTGYRTSCFVRTLCLIRTSWLFGGKNTEAICEYACKALQQSGNLATPTTQPWKDFYLMFWFIQQARHRGKACAWCQQSLSVN